jgi:hypothetical protein
VQVEPETNRVTLSKIFLWYATDFGSSTTQVLRWIAPRLSAERSQALTAMLDAEVAGGEGITVEYAAYDWGINSN